MDWKLTATTFVAILIAEMGDKTQLAAFALAGGGSSKWAVFIGASTALIVTTAIAVLAGGLVGRYVPQVWIRRGAGVIFLAIGVLFLLARPEAPEQDGAPPPSSHQSSAGERGDGNH